MLFYIGTFRRSKKTLEQQARKRVIEATGNENPNIRFSIGTYLRSKRSLEEQVRQMIKQNQIPEEEEST